MLDYIFEVILMIFVETIGRQIFIPFFRFTGGIIRWTFNLGQKSLEEISFKKYNGRIGVVFWTLIIVILYINIY